VFENLRYLITIILGLTLAASCSSKRGEPGVESTSNSKVVSATPPFQTKEPNRYQAIRAVSFAPASGAEPIVTRNAIAKDGEMRREEDTGGSKRVVYLDLPTGRFLLLPDERLYASLNDNAIPQDPPNAQSDESGDLYLHGGPIQSAYESVGSEDVNGRMTKKYRVVVNSFPVGTVSNGETLIWVDETLGMPIKSVTTSAGGIRTMELSEVRLEVDTGLFQIPPDYQKIDARSLRQRIR
jgi:hypothetical protein